MLKKMSEILEASDLSVRKSMFVPQETDERKTPDEIKRDLDQQQASDALLEKKPTEQDQQKVKAFWDERKKLNDQLKVCIMFLFEYNHF